MNSLECPREQEVLAAVFSRRWDTCDEDLRLHAAGCEVCRDAATVATLLREDEQQTRQEVQVPAAGQVWWRAAIRARLEAVHAAERPLTWLHGLAGAIAVGLVAGLLGMAWPTIQEAGTAIASWSWMPGTGTVKLMVSAVQRSLPLVSLVVAFAVLAPIAIYLATSED